MKTLPRVKAKQREMGTICQEGWKIARSHSVKGQYKFLGLGQHNKYSSCKKLHIALSFVRKINISQKFFSNITTMLHK